MLIYSDLQGHSQVGQPEQRKAGYKEVEEENEQWEEFNFNY